MNNKNIDLLSNQPVYKSIVKLSLPMVMGMMVQELHWLLLLVLNATLGFNGFIYAQPTTDIIMRILSSMYIAMIFSKELLGINSKINTKDTII